MADKWLWPEFIAYCFIGFLMAVPTSYLIVWLSTVYHQHWWVWPTVFWLLCVAGCGFAIMVSCVGRALTGGIEEGV